ncbi:MAG: DUF2924 domain-containing protein [Marinosulfonomonas sp.]
MARRYSRKADLADDLREIALLDRPGCLAQWKTVFGATPPPYLSVRFMQRVLMHDLQCRVLGGYSGKTTRALSALIEGGAGNGAGSGESKPGSVLLREWNGRTYRVEGTPEGYVLDGKTYRSLSGVARQITGANWSGPRFFGLKQRAGG